jgi:hypothetical protein
MKRHSEPCSWVQTNVPTQRGVWWDGREGRVPTLCGSESPWSLNKDCACTANGCWLIGAPPWESPSRQGNQLCSGKYKYCRVHSMTRKRKWRQRGGKKHSVSRDKIGDVCQKPRIRHSAPFWIPLRSFICENGSSPRTLQSYSNLLRINAMYTCLRRWLEAPLRALNALSTFRRLRHSFRTDWTWAAKFGRGESKVTP